MIRTGTWKSNPNSRGISLIVSGRDVKGTMHAARGRPSPNEVFELIGFTDGEIICFSVIWSNDKNQYHSAAAWVGRYFKQEITGKHPVGEYIDVSWHLCRKFSDEKFTRENEISKSYIVGTELFKLYE